MRAKIKTWLQRKLMALIGADIKKELANMRLDIDERQRAAIKRLSKQVEERVAAVMAVDAPFHGDAGMIVVIGRLAEGKDIVKVIDLAPRMQPQELREMISLLERSFAARPEFIDATGPMPEFLRGGPRRRIVPRAPDPWFPRGGGH